ncbi:hypothetical protein EYF80_049676 [Liparis tanakae]|uniref:Uncharacterized protein n=1 Tax=Liparis tanakae TaxID=230148 RepID=A0A4Z2FH88_9TELE|nr:hypothetical protein EYF80_049676 [Liparis tanakae]
MLCYSSHSFPSSVARGDLYLRWKVAVSTMMLLDREKDSTVNNMRRGRYRVDSTGGQVCVQDGDDGRSRVSQDGIIHHIQEVHQLQETDKPFSILHSKWISVEYNFPMTLVLLDHVMERERFKHWLEQSGLSLLNESLVTRVTFGSVRAWRRPLPMTTVRERRLRLWGGRGADCWGFPDDSLAK